MKQDEKTHKLVASPKTVHTGFFDAALPPVLTIESGDTVVMNSLTLLDGQLRSGMTLDEVMAARQKYADLQIGTHTLTGPIFVKGAEPGDVLEIRIQKLIPAESGVNYHFPGRLGVGGLPEDFPDGQIKAFKMDLKKMEAAFAPGVVLPLKPFFGVMGVAPAPERKGLPPFRIISAEIWTIRNWSRGPLFFCPSMCPGPFFPPGMPTRFKETARSILPPLRRQWPKPSCNFSYAKI